MRGLPIGAIAPNFTLLNLEGRTYSFYDSLACPQILLFIDPYTQACRLAIERVSESFHKTKGFGLSICIVSRGDIHVNRKRLTQVAGSIPVLLQKRWEVAQNYMIFLVPAMYLVGVDRRITHEVVVGWKKIESLLLKLTTP